MSAGELPLGYAAIAGGALLLVAGLTGSTIASVAKGAPDKSKAAGPQPPAGTASSSSSSPSSPGLTQELPSAKGLANPHPGFTKGRTDQGVDFAGRPGAPIYAIAPGRVLGIIQDWYAGQPFLYYEATAGALKGRVLYVAEQIVPTVRVGQHFAAGQQIATYAASGSAIEEGYATRSGQTLARATTGYSEGQETPAGVSFRRLYESVTSRSPF